MAIIFIPPVLISFLVGVFLYFYAKDRKYEPTFFYCFFGPVITFVSLCTFMFLLGVEFSDRSDYRRIKTSSDLVSLNNNISSAGSFFLGIGSFSGQKRYYYYVNTSRGVISRSVDAGRAFIVEHDTTSEGSFEPKIVRYEYDTILDQLSWYVPHPGKYSTYYRIHVPEGSIKTEYNFQN